MQMVCFPVAEKKLNPGALAVLQSFDLREYCSLPGTCGSSHSTSLSLLLFPNPVRYCCIFQGEKEYFLHHSLQSLVSVMLLFVKAMLNETVNIAQCRNTEGKRMFLREVQQQNLRINPGLNL